MVGVALEMEGVELESNTAATPEIPLPSPKLEFASFKCSSQVEPGAFTSNLTNHLRTLYAQ